MIIYKITNKINGKIYVGQTINSLQRRIAHYRGETDDRPIVNALQKYGMNNFIFEIIDKAASIEDLNEKEIFWIKKLNSTDRSIGYNIREGGANSPLSPETKLKLSIQRTGEQNPFYGKHHSSDFCEKKSKLMIGKNNVMFGENHTDDTKQLIRESRKDYVGENHPRWGATLTDETKSKISESLKIFNENQIIEVLKLRKLGLTYLELAKEFNVSRGTIYRTLRDNLKWNQNE